MCCRLRKAGDLNGEEVSVKQELSTPAKVSRYWWMDLSEKKGESPKEKKTCMGNITALVMKLSYTMM